MKKKIVALMVMMAIMCWAASALAISVVVPETVDKAGFWHYDADYSLYIYQEGDEFVIRESYDDGSSLTLWYDSQGQFEGYVYGAVVNDLKDRITIAYNSDGTITNVNYFEANYDGIWEHRTHWDFDANRWLKGKIPVDLPAFDIADYPLDLIFVDADPAVNTTPEPDATQTPETISYVLPGTVAGFSDTLPSGGPKIDAQKVDDHYEFAIDWNAISYEYVAFLVDNGTEYLDINGSYDESRGVCVSDSVPDGYQLTDLFFAVQDAATGNYYNVSHAFGDDGIGRGNYSLTKGDYAYHIGYDENGENTSYTYSVYGYGDAQVDVEYGTDGAVMSYRTITQLENTDMVIITYSADGSVFGARYDTDYEDGVWQRYYEWDWLSSQWIDWDGNIGEDIPPFNPDDYSYDIEFTGLEKEPQSKPSAIWYPNNTVGVLGLSLRDDLGMTDKWYNVVPVDLTQNGTQTVRLVASNIYYFGAATITVADGNVNVNYTMPNGLAYMKDECLQWFTSLDEIDASFLENPVGEYAFGEPVSISGELNGQDVALLFICNHVTYRQPVTYEGAMLTRYYRNRTEWVAWRGQLMGLLERME